MQLEHNDQEYSDLLNSDSLDDKADESPERAIDISHRLLPTPVIPVISAPVTPGQPVALVTPVNTGQSISAQSTEHIRLGLMLMIIDQL